MAGGGRWGGVGKMFEDLDGGEWDEAARGGLGGPELGGGVHCGV